MSDEQLALAAQGGDGEAMRELLEKYKGAVRGVSRSYFLAGGDPEDLVQEGMIGLYAAISDYRAGGMNFKNFAYLCIHRRIQSAVKSASRQKHFPLNSYVPLVNADGQGADVVSPEDPEAALISDEEGREFSEALERELSPAEHRALLAYMEGLSLAEIAAREGKSVKSADNAVQRAKKKAAKLLLRGDRRGKERP